MSDGKQRKQRSDTGLVMATRRDLSCIAWIAEQYAARTDQIRTLLSRFPDKEKPFKDGALMAETTVKDQLDRWKRAGWIEYRRVLADEPGSADPTSCTVSLKWSTPRYQHHGNGTIHRELPHLSCRVVQSSLLPSVIREDMVYFSKDRKEIEPCLTQ